jgi:hypothetical protein
MRLFIAAAGAFWLAACATAVGTAYAPADNKGYGYADTRIEADRYRITFSGDGATPQDVVEDYALLRAADIALSNSYDWFRVVSRDVSRENKGGVGIGAGVGGGGRNVGVGVGGDLGTIGAKPFYTVRLEVLFGKGPKPEGPDYYDARAVKEMVKARVAA